MSVLQLREKVARGRMVPLEELGLAEFEVREEEVLCYEGPCGAEVVPKTQVAWRGNILLLLVALAPFLLQFVAFVKRENISKIFAYDCSQLIGFHYLIIPH